MVVDPLVSVESLPGAPAFALPETRAPIFWEFGVLKRLFGWALLSFDNGGLVAAFCGLFDGPFRPAALRNEGIFWLPGLPELPGLPVDRCFPVLPGLPELPGLPVDRFLPGLRMLKLVVFGMFP